MYKLNDLFLSYDQLRDDEKEKNLFYVRFYVLRVTPDDVRELVQAYCKLCKAFFSLKGQQEAPKYMCNHCQKPCDLGFKVQLLVKD